MTSKALIVIDLEKGFINKNTKHLPDGLKRLLERRGGDFDLILFTQFRNYPNSYFVKNLGYKGFMTKYKYEIVNELNIFVNKGNLFTKNTYSSFTNQKLYNVLKKNKISEVYLVGIDTENCVLTFARDAFDRGFKVVVLKNYCASHSDYSLHKAALKIIKNNIGDVRQY